MKDAAQRKLDRARLALFPPEEKIDDRNWIDHSADGNLEAVIIDLEMRGTHNGV